MNVLFNGTIIDESEAVIPITDKAMWYDFGIYESMKVVQGKTFYPDKHIKRFFDSAALLHMNLGFSHEEVSSWIDTLIADQQVDNGLIRMCAYGDTEKNEQASIYMFALGLTFYPRPYYSQGVKAITFQGERYLPQAKTLNMLVNFLAYKEAQNAGALEALLIDHKGNVTEGTRTNFFIVEKGKIITSPLKTILGGVTRDMLLTWAQKADYTIIESDINTERMFKADEVFITSTSMNVIPVVEIDNTPIKDGTVGPMAKTLNKLFKENQRAYFAKLTNE